MTALASTPADRFARIFSESEPGTTRRRWWDGRGRRRALVVALVVALVSVVLATQAFGSSGSDYRVATVARRDVDATLTGVGTIEPISQATVAFPVSGTVASVPVRVGDVVGVGTILASLDTDSLEQTVHQKQAALAQAELTLSRALAGESVSGATGGAGATGGSGASGSGASGGSGGSGTDATFSSMRSTASERIVFMAAESPGSRDPELAAAQQAVLDGQQYVDAALAAAESSLQAAVSVCAPVVDAQVTADAAPTTPGAGTSSGDSTSNGPAAGADSTTRGSGAATGPSSNDLTVCQQAIKDTLAAQSALADAQRSLASASSALDDLLAQRAAAVPEPAAPAPTAPSAPEPSAPAPSAQASPAPSATTSPGSGGEGEQTAPVIGGTGRDAGTNGAGGAGGAAGGAIGAGGGSNPSGSSSRSTSPSAADLASYQKAVDAASAQVAVAQQALAQATIASPIAGTVVAANLAVGDSVTSGSSTANVIVQGEGGFEVSTTIGIDRITHVEVGQAASVVPDGSDTPLEGKVSSIGIVPDPNSSTTSYLVRIGLEQPGKALDNGATGTVSIVTQSARSALAVPTSAVTTTGSRHTVEVLDGDGTRQVAVQVGAVGGTWTEIKSGLSSGQTVVLADVSAPLPSSATSSSNGTQTNPFATGFGGRLPNGFPGTGGR